MEVEDTAGSQGAESSRKNSPMTMMTPAGLKRVDAVTASTGSTTSPDDDDIEEVSLNDVPRVERDDDLSSVDEDDSDYDSDEGRDGFSIGDEEDDDSASNYSSASSMATDSQSVGSDAASSATGTAVEDNDRESHKIARSEVRAAKCGRYCALFFLLVILGVLLPYTLYAVANSHEEASFEETVLSLSDELGDAWRENVVRAFSALDSIAVDSTMATAAELWPTVTIPDFPVWSMNAKYASASIQSNVLTPIVEENERTDYELYIKDNQEWIKQSEDWAEFSIDDRRRLQADAPNSTGEIRDQIFELNDGIPVASSGPGPFYPIRHMHPLHRESINYDLASNMYISAELIFSAGNSSAVMGRFLDGNDDESDYLLRAFLSDAIKSDELYGSMVYPVLHRVEPNMKGVMVSSVGAVVALVSWTSLLTDALPSRAKGFLVVVRNSCGQVASLRVDGPNVTFLGFKDAHDIAFESYRSTYDLQNLQLEGTTISQRFVNDNQAEVCQYRLDVYPSTATQQAYETINPMVYVGVGLGAFFVTLLLFLIYDRFLERRNRAILSSAIEARAIVSSLFPANVRDRLFETNRVKRKKKKKLKKLKKKMKKLKRLRRKKKENTPEGDPRDGDDPESPHKSPESALKDAPLSASAVQSILESVQPALGNSLRDLGLGGPKLQSGVSHPKHQLKNLLASTPASLVDQSEEFGLNKPIADLFPHTTVLFADIVGFTAWSSERSPEDVFTLLQTIYAAFDKVARRRGVFKVETIGDCYVAVTGLPEPQPDHAVRMTKFARECMTKMTEVTKRLEIALGPDTGDLCMRLGLNSGPVTAGVLQGEKSRFQLFGDTVNTAARMESTGETNRVQMSKSTADLLTQAGKGYWVKPRDDLVHAKGKGNVQTYWLVSRADNFSLQANRSTDELDREIKRVAPSRSRSTFTKGEPTRGLQRTTSDSVTKVDKLSDMVTQGREGNDKREERLIQWQLELFVRLLKQIVAARDEAPKPATPPSNEGWSKSSHSYSVSHSFENSFQNISEHTTSLESHTSAVVDRFSQQQVLGSAPIRMPQRESSIRMPKRRLSTQSVGFDASVSTFHSSFGEMSATEGGDVEDDDDKIVVDEVVEIITLPKFNPKSIKALEKFQTVELDEAVVTQLQDYITTIAQMYRKNPFHNFEHASHVTMSANKLLNRIVIPENVDYDRESNDIASDLHDYTYGITSDPLTQFAVVFSALVHDVDHTGVPNGRLAVENPDMAAVYRNQSLAEQNSVDLAWDLFMDPRYKQLQDCIAATDAERKRFRQLVVNSVMATDIFDPKMKALRNTRWDKAFHRDGNGATEITETVMEEDRNMKATIVIEHIIQASDVAHTMQHWHIYQKWNERLFDEMYSAFECGRSDKNPADGWYKGELWFFDNYVIPLAKKLEECNVFGVASDECLNYAQANRNEWSIKGEEVVEEMVQRYQQRKFFVAGLAKKKHPNKRPARRLPRGDSARSTS